MSDSDNLQIILEELRGMRSEFSSTVNRIHTRIDKVEEKAGVAMKRANDANTTALVNKTKIGTFIAGISFAFTGLGTFLSHWVKEYFSK